MNVKTYAFLSTLIGLLLLVDGTFLMTVGTIPFPEATMALEYIWILVAFIGIWLYHRRGYSKFIPFSYILFLVVDALYNIYHQTLVKAAEGPVELPFTYKALYVCFGLFFFLMNLRVFAHAKSR